MKVFEFILQAESLQGCCLDETDFWGCIDDFKASIVAEYQVLSDAYVDKIVHSSVKHSEPDKPETWEAEIQLASSMLGIGYQIGLADDARSLHKSSIISPYLCDPDRASWSKIRRFHIDTLRFLLFTWHDNTWRGNVADLPNLPPDL